MGKDMPVQEGNCVIIAGVCELQTDIWAVVRGKYGNSPTQREFWFEGNGIWGGQCGM